MERLHKVLAHAGVGSRRRCEEIIAEGSVLVNDALVRELGFKVDPQRDKIYYNGRLIKPEKTVYFLVNKPVNYLCSNYDRDGRPLVVNLFRHLPYRLYTVGRLDADSEGLVIVTNDGELCNQLTHPRYEVPKTYTVCLRGFVDDNIIEKVKRGVWLAEGKTAPTRITVIRRTRDFTLLEMVLKEGKKREIRRVFARFGCKVTSLVRTKIGRLTLGNLPPGKFREVGRDLILKMTNPR